MNEKQKLQDEVIALYNARLAHIKSSPMKHYSCGMAAGLALGMSIKELKAWKSRLEKVSPK